MSVRFDDPNLVSCAGLAAVGGSRLRSAEEGHSQQTHLRNCDPAASILDTDRYRRILAADTPDELLNELLAAV